MFKINLLINFFKIKNFFSSLKNNNIQIKNYLKNSKIIIKGDKNLVLIKKSDIKRLKVGIYGENNTLESHLQIIKNNP